ncbi:hypothetical protein OAT71_02385 [Flavobacteriales bacterium]|nr:hypothetical protein [Flavobacteriales bacterium]
MNNKKSTYYRVEGLKNDTLVDSLVHNVNWWRYNPSYNLGFGTKGQSSYASVELKSMDTISVGPKRRLCYRLVQPGMSKLELKRGLLV